MTIRRPGWRGLVGAVAVIGLSAGVTLGVLTVTGVTFQSSTEAEPTQLNLSQASPSPAPFSSWYLTGPLVTSNRDRLALCVEAVGFSAAEAAGVELTAKQALDAAFEQVKLHPYWSKLSDLTAIDEPLIDIGCPSEPAIYGERWLPDQPAGPPNARGRLVEEPSYYRAFVFVVTPDEISKIVTGPDIGFRRSTEEVWVEGDRGSGLTAGLYFGPEDLLNTALLVDSLEKVAGLERSY